MKKLLPALFLFFLCGFTFNPQVRADDLLNQIIITDGKYAIANHKLVQQKVTDLSAKLNLTDKQKEKVNLIVQESTKKVSSTLFKLADIKERKALIALKKGTLTNAQQLKSGKDYLRTTRVKIKAIREDNMKKFEEILTDEQKIDFNKFKSELAGLSKSSSTSDRSLNFDLEETTDK